MEDSSPGPAIPLGFGRPMRVLLVEDDPDQAQLAFTLVNGCGDGPDLFQIEWKNNILQAISRLAKPGIDVVLLDLGMLTVPLVTGFNIEFSEIMTERPQ